jgi:hypothetical protein
VDDDLRTAREEARELAATHPALATKLHEIGAARLSGEPQPPHTGQVLIAVSGATAAAAMLLNDTAVRITEVLAESHSAPSAH